MMDKIAGQAGNHSSVIIKRRILMATTNETTQKGPVPKKRFKTPIPIKFTARAIKMNQNGNLCLFEGASMVFILPDGTEVAGSVGIHPQGGGSVWMQLGNNEADAKRITSLLEEQTASGSSPKAEKRKAW